MFILYFTVLLTIRAGTMYSFKCYNIFPDDRIWFLEREPDQAIPSIINLTAILSKSPDYSIDKQQFQFHVKKCNKSLALITNKSKNNYLCLNNWQRKLHPAVFSRNLMHTEMNFLTNFRLKIRSNVLLVKVFPTLIDRK